MATGEARCSRLRQKPWRGLSVCCAETNFGASSTVLNFSTCRAPLRESFCTATRSHRDGKADSSVLISATHTLFKTSNSFIFCMVFPVHYSMRRRSLSHE